MSKKRTQEEYLQAKLEGIRKVNMKKTRAQRDRYANNAIKNLVLVKWIKKEINKDAKKVSESD